MIKIVRHLVILITVFISVSAFSQEQYDRTKHFPHWLDLDGNGMDTRQDALNNQSIDGKFWVCPYTGAVITDPKKLAADHIVSLKAAWDCGASEWVQETRILFANDPENILMVLSSANSSKSDKRPEEWMPMNMSFWDEFINKTRHIYSKYQLNCPDPDPNDVFTKAGKSNGATKRLLDEIKSQYSGD